MSEDIWISASTPVHPIEVRLQQELCCLEDAGIKLTTETSQLKAFQFLNCQIQYQGSPLSREEGRLLSRQYIANVLADTVVEDWQPTTLSRLLQRRYSFFTRGEQSEIVNKAKEALTAHDSALYRVSRKIRVREVFSRYLASEDFINLDGFLNFRLKSYQRELEEVLDAVVDEYLGAREEREFIRLLQNFLHILEPKCDVAHLLITGEAQFSILDEQGELLRCDVLETVISREDDSLQEYEDVMISSLLSIAPRHLVIHAGTFIGRPSILDTLQQIFRQRAETCTDCDLCARLIFQQQEHPDQR
ncbi:MAG: sporulation protein YtxC [Bacillota bacterium]|jgi:putative sporulation protein YtxC